MRPGVEGQQQGPAAGLEGPLGAWEQRAQAGGWPEASLGLREPGRDSTRLWIR